MSPQNLYELQLPAPQHLALAQAASPLNRTEHQAGDLVWVNLGSAPPAEDGRWRSSPHWIPAVISQTDYPDYVLQYVEPGQTLNLNEDYPEHVLGILATPSMLAPLDAAPEEGWTTEQRRAVGNIQAVVQFQQDLKTRLEQEAAARVSAEEQRKQQEREARVIGTLSRLDDAAIARVMAAVQEKRFNKETP